MFQRFDLMNTKPSVEGVMGENNLIICSIQHPEDHNFLSKLSDFMQEHGYSFFQRYSYHNLEKIFLLAENLTKASMENVMNFVENEQESAKIIHFPGFNYVPEQNYFPKAIMMAIEDSDIVVALMDRTGRKNQWINQEVGYAMAKDIHVLALAESRKELKGFVNMYTKIIIEGDEISLPKGMELWLVEFEKEIAEKILTNLIEASIPELKRRIDYETYQLNFYKPTDKQKRVLDNLMQEIKRLEQSYELLGFYSAEKLDAIRKSITQITKVGFSKIFNNYCNEFDKPLEELIQSRRNRYQYDR